MANFYAKVILKISVFPVIIVAVILDSCSPLKVVNCPPKFTIYKDVNKAYPSYSKGFNITIANTISTSNKISDTASVSIRKDIVKLKDNLNNISSRFEDLIKYNLMIYYSSICDEIVRRKFADSQEKLSNVIIKLSEVEASIGNSKGVSSSNGKNVENAVNATENIIKRFDSGEYKIN